MLLDSNILIYGANGEHPALDEILDRTDLAAASVTRIETLGFHRLSEIERRWTTRSPWSYAPSCRRREAGMPTFRLSTHNFQPATVLNHNRFELPRRPSPLPSADKAMPDEFIYDVFLTHSAQNKAVVRPLAERLRKDGVKPKAEGKRQKDDIEPHPSSFPSRPAEQAAPLPSPAPRRRPHQRLPGAIRLCQPRPMLIPCCRWN